MNLHSSISCILWVRCVYRPNRCHRSLGPDRSHGSSGRGGYSWGGRERDRGGHRSHWSLRTEWRDRRFWVNRAEGRDRWNWLHGSYWSYRGYWEHGESSESSGHNPKGPVINNLVGVSVFLDHLVKTIVIPPRTVSEKVHPDHA